jgi:superfamily II DNA or RNA helicase
MAEIKVGDLVRTMSGVPRMGKVLEIFLDEQIQETLTRVHFADGTETVLLKNLEYFDVPADPWEDLVRGRLSAAVPFRTLLTFVRIKTPPSPIVSAFGTARVRFYPYQFKPLLKFLENPNQRLLIADDVGLGKTIEAGYILREWRARQGLTNVLVVVPARLKPKWQQELKQRFDENFDLVDSREISTVLNRVIRGGEMPEFNWIASYETLRSRKMVSLLEEVRPALDLLIMDEAHRVRNRKTNQYHCADILKDCSDAIIYLTATPVQTGIDNLYTLVRLLMPDTFESRQVFDEVTEANRPIIRACQMLSRGELQGAAIELETLSEKRLTASLMNDSYFQDVIRRLRTIDVKDRAALVRLQRDVNEFSLLGFLFSRTRKIEVMENWPLREPQNPHIELSEDEQHIYDSVRLILRLLNPEREGWASTLAAITAYRYTASCIPAAAAYFRERLAMGELLPGTKDLGNEEEREFMDFLRDQEKDWEGEISVSAEIRKAIESILDHCPSPGKDSKYSALLKVFNDIWKFDRQQNRPPRKIVVFSYFKRTLGYLHAQLSVKGIATCVIHGGIQIEERLDRIERFLNDETVNVLLSSEVGGEGIDLQKASVIVNYDLPWNPMVVEQRIGRIDRIGQMADRLVIVNLVAEGTIEQKILLRLYERIGLFRECIGEMDEILGPLDLHRLIVEALSGDLSDDEIRERVDRNATAAHQKLEEAKKLSKQVDGLLAADQAFLDEINALIRTRRVPNPGDLKTLLLEILEKKFSGILYTPDKSRNPGSLTLGRDAVLALGNWARTYSGEAHRMAQRFQYQGTVPVTFDADMAMDHPRAEFIQARHPLIQFTIGLIERDSAGQLKTFGLRSRTKKLFPGIWVLGIWSLTLMASRPETQLEVVACNLKTKAVLSGPDADDLFVACMDDSDELDMAMQSIQEEEVRSCIPLVKEAYSRRRAAVIQEAKETEERKLSRVRSTWIQTLIIRRDAAKNRLELMLQKGAKDFALRMGQAIVEKREKALKDKEAELSIGTNVDWKEKEIAALILIIEKP